MNRKIYLLLLASACTLPALSQANEPKAYTNFPLVITLQFHAFSLPFRDMKANFQNLGIGLGTEVSLNGKSNWVQQVNVVWYHNKAMGNGLLLYTQNAWRPDIATNTFAEVKGGVGYLHSFRPVESFHQINGKWISVGHKGKGMLALPVGVSLGYDSRSASSYISNFASYQFMLINGYNKTIPIVPETLVQLGTRVHF